jgi:hypothetical protein
MQHSDYRILNKILDFLVILFIQKIYRYILYINNDRNPRTFNFTPGSGQTVTGLHLSPPREAGPLTRNVMFRKNSYLL